MLLLNYKRKISNKILQGEQTANHNGFFFADTVSELELKKEKKNSANIFKFSSISILAIRVARDYSELFHYSNFLDRYYWASVDVKASFTIFEGVQNYRNTAPVVAPVMYADIKMTFLLLTFLHQGVEYAS